MKAWWGLIEEIDRVFGGDGVLRFGVVFRVFLLETSGFGLFYLLVSIVVLFVYLLFI